MKKSGHDLHRFELIHSSPLKECIEACGIEIEDIVKVWTNADKISSIINEIIQGPLGADRMDFTLRDSYYTGTSHFGTIACERIMSESLIIEDKLVYKKKIFSDMIHTFYARYHMYKEVYYHKTSVGASLLLRKF